MSLIQFAVALALACGLHSTTSDSVDSVRLSVLIEQYSSTGVLGSKVQCSPDLSKLSVSMCIRRQERASEILAELLNASWLGSKDSIVLTRTREQVSQIERQQEEVLKDAAQAKLAQMEPEIIEAMRDLQSFGHRIVKEFELMRLSRQPSIAPLSKPIDLIGKASLLDLGAKEIAKLRLGGTLFISDRTDGVNRRYGKTALAAIEAYRKAFDEPAVREAMVAIRKEWGNQFPHPDELLDARFFTWLSRDPLGIVVSTWVYSSEGTLLDRRIVRILLELPAPLRSELGDDPRVAQTRLNPSEATLRIAKTLVSNASATGRASLRQSLMDVPQESLVCSLGRDMVGALRTAFPEYNVAALLDEAWVLTAAASLNAGETRLSVILESLAKVRGIRMYVKTNTLYVKPIVASDLIAITADPKAIFSYLNEVFSPSGESMEGFCRFASSLNLALDYGLGRTYRLLAGAAGAELMLNSQLKDRALASFLGSLVPFPDVNERERTLKGVSPDQISRARLAIASHNMVPAPEFKNCPPVSQRTSIYVDHQIAQMPWSIRAGQESFYAMDLGTEKVGPYSKDEFAEALAKIFRSALDADREKLESFPALFANAKTWEIRTAVLPSAVWWTKLIDRIAWPSASSKLSQTPGGSWIIGRVLELAGPPGRSDEKKR